MRHAMFPFVLFCQLIVVSGVLAQDDASSSSSIESLDPLAECLRDCSARNEMCVTTAAVPDCISHVPSCEGMAPRSAEIIAAFCEACGRAAIGCNPAPMSTVAGTGTAPYSSAPVAPMLPSIPIVGTVPRARVRPPTAEERARSEQERARGICERQRGVWNPATVVLMPDDSLLVGVCRTPEGAELLHMIEEEQRTRATADEALGRRITGEETTRVEAYRRLDSRLTSNARDDRVRDSRIATLFAMVTCLQTRAERLPLARFDANTQERLRDSGLVENGYFICHSYRAPVAAPADASGGGFGLHLRLQTFGHIGFTALHPSLVQSRGAGEALPVGLGFDATVYGALSDGWYIEGGAGLSYDWPDFKPFATNARLWYHAGLSALVSPAVSIGIGYLGSDRFRPNLQSAYSFHGAYLDLTVHIRLRRDSGGIRTSNDVTDPAMVVTLRGGFGAAFRPAAATAADGLLQIMTGFEF